MIEVELRGLSNNSHDKTTVNDSSEWIAWRNLDLYDNDQQKPISEWFYVAACSPKYLDSNISKFSEIELKSILIQSELDELALSKFALEKFSTLQFESWDDFYKKMSTEFMYED